MEIKIKRGKRLTVADLKNLLVGTRPTDDTEVKIYVDIYDAATHSATLRRVDEERSIVADRNSFIINTGITMEA